MFATLPNILTLSRILAVPLLVLLLWDPAWWWGEVMAFALYCLMGLTDYFDGYVARAQGTVSKLGIFLDPVADKIMVVAVIVMLIATRVITGWPVVAALVILLREIMVSGLREYLATVRVSMPVSQLAKWKTAFQMIALGALILHTPVKHTILPAFMVGIICLWIAALLTLITGYDYLRTGLRHME